MTVVAEVPISALFRVSVYLFCILARYIRFIPESLVGLSLFLYLWKMDKHWLLVPETCKSMMWLLHTLIWASLLVETFSQHLLLANISLSSTSSSVQDLEYYGIWGKKRNLSIFLEIEQEISLFFVFQFPQYRYT